MEPKRKKYTCKFNQEWKSEFAFLTTRFKGTGYALCKVFPADFSVEHGGRTDIKHHANTGKHKKAVAASESQPSIAGLLGKGRPDAVIYAETKMAMLVAKNNIPLSFTDEINKSVRDMFPDSDVAKKYACGRTKAAQILKGNPLTYP